MEKILQNASCSVMRQGVRRTAYQIQNWQGIVQQALQRQTKSIIRAYLPQNINAINTVAKSSYSYVYTKKALLVAPLRRMIYYRW